MQSDFKIGDVVQLNSGSPCMTVSAIKDNEIVVTWFDSGNILHTGTFDFNLLCHYKTLQLSF